MQVGLNHFKYVHYTSCFVLVIPLGRIIAYVERTVFPRGKPSRVQSLKVSKHSLLYIIHIYIHNTYVHMNIYSVCIYAYILYIYIYSFFLTT